MSSFKRIGVAEFKTAIGAGQLDVVKNPTTGKLFVSASNGDNFKCQQDLDVAKPVHFLVENGNLSAACLINQDRGTSAAPLLTL